jgi:uncharacterized protein (TIGR02996 family)
MNERDALLAGVLGRSPGDWSSLLVFADWLEDHGEDSQSYAYRWVAHRRRWPYVSRKYRVIRWTAAPARPADLAGKYPEMLPRPLFDALKARERRGGYKTIPEAFEALALALQKLRNIVEF